MGLLGTLIGGSIGFMMGGPIGMIIGSVLGQSFSGVKTGVRPDHPGGRTYGGGAYNPLQAQQTFMVAMISLAAKVAKADGHVTPEEVRSFDQFLRINLRMSADERQVAARIFNEARDSEIPAEEFARQIRSLLGHQPDRLRDMISLLMQIAMADGHLHPAEESLIKSIAASMGLTNRDFEESAAMFNPSANLDSAYAVLGVTRDTADADVKKSYRRLAKEYHPDVVTQKGMGEDFQKFAAQKMRAINDAYDQVKEARGF